MPDQIRRMRLLDRLRYAKLSLRELQQTLAATATLPPGGNDALDDTLSTSFRQHLYAKYVRPAAGPGTGTGTGAGAGTTAGAASNGHAEASAGTAAPHAASPSAKPAAASPAKPASASSAATADVPRPAHA